MWLMYDSRANRLCFCRVGSTELVARSCCSVGPEEGAGPALLGPQQAFNAHQPGRSFHWPSCSSHARQLANPAWPDSSCQLQQGVCCQLLMVSALGSKQHCVGSPASQAHKPGVELLMWASRIRAHSFCLAFCPLCQTSWVPPSRMVTG